MKLYVFPPSPNAFFPLCVLHHLGVDAEMEIVDLTKGATRTPEYAALNPNQLMPTLVDGDFVLWESTAIAQYLCSKAEGQTLWPSDPQRQADVSRWLAWRLAHFGPACGTLIFQNLVKGLLGDTSGPDPAKVAEGNEQVGKYAGILDRHLAGREWIVGDGVTLADFALAPWLHYREPAKLPVGEMANLLAWHGRVAALDGYVRATPQPVAA